MAETSKNLNIYNMNINLRRRILHCTVYLTEVYLILPHTTLNITQRQYFIYIESSLIDMRLSVGLINDLMCLILGEPIELGQVQCMGGGGGLAKILHSFIPFLPARSLNYVIAFLTLLPHSTVIFLQQHSTYIRKCFKV